LKLSTNTRQFPDQGVNDEGYVPGKAVTRRVVPFIVAYQQSAASLVVRESESLHQRVTPDDYSGMALVTSGLKHPPEYSDTHGTVGVQQFIRYRAIEQVHVLNRGARGLGNLPKGPDATTWVKLPELFRRVDDKV
jgi:hypothetical protein